MREFSRVALLPVFVFAAGCALNLDQLVPQAVISDVSGGPVKISVCKPAGLATPAILASLQAQRLRQIQNNIAFVRNAIPQLTTHPIVNAAFEHVQFASSNALITGRKILGASTPEEENQVASIRRPTPVSASDVGQFSHTVADAVLRNTGGTPDTFNAEAQQFWTDVKAYYTQYYQGSFTNYFSQTIQKPTIQLTIGDDEITAAAGVFLELLFDELLTPTVWTDGTLFYPGAGKTKPTYLTVFNQKPATLLTPDGACGMTLAKVKTITYLAQTFATAGSGEVSVSVKSFGGLEVGLGIFGKLSVGDNSTLTKLVQAVVSEAIERLTVEIAAPVLEAIQVTPANSPAAPSTIVGGKGAKTIQMYSAPFVSSTKTTL